MDVPASFNEERPFQKGLIIPECRNCRDDRYEVDGRPSQVSPMGEGGRHSVAAAVIIIDSTGPLSAVLTPVKAPFITHLQRSGITFALDTCGV